MASSQVEIASSSSSSSPFGCILRDRNRRDGCRESNAFQRNIKNFVMDHLNTCISKSSGSDSATNENKDTGQNLNNNAAAAAASWASKPANNNNLARLRFKRNNHSIINDKEKDESSLASLISPRHSRLLDRWAAKQAREMVSTLENEEAELLAIDNSSNSILTRTSSSNSDECSSETLKLGASSLVQMWEKRLNQTSVSKPNTPVRSSPSSATGSNNNAFSVEEQSKVLDTVTVECCEFPSVNEEPFPDWESDKTGQSDQSVSPGRWGSSESDRVSVADIIKRLQTQNDDNDQEGCGGGGSSVADSPCRERDIGSTAENSEQRVFPQVTCTPRIRGRKAFDDLLMKLEQDRHGELKNLAERGAVSKFTQRGRIQSLFRLRLMQRGVTASEPSSQKPTASEVNKQPAQGSIIMQLRERFSNGVEQRTLPKSPRREVANNTTQLDNSPSVDQLSKDKSSKTSHGTANQSTESTQNTVSKTSEEHNRQEAHPSSDTTIQETNCEAQHDDLQETAEATASRTDSSTNEKAEQRNQQCAMSKSSVDETVDEEEASNQQFAETSHDYAVEEEEACNQNYAESSCEELESINQSYCETNSDWISEISRPRSYWEERRQAWYREMLDSGSQKKEDIKKLLERRTVSTFLTSDFRETMDRLMASHRGTQTHLVNSEDGEVDNQELMAFLQKRLHSARTPQEYGRERGEERIEEEVEEVEEEEQEEKADEDEHEHEVCDDSNPCSSWSYRDNEAGDDFDRVVSTSSQPYQSLTYGDSRRNSSSSHHNSIEMELIYDMRGNMEQLYREMSELRKSIRSCMDMQMQLQQSMNQEIQTVKKEENKSHNRAPKKGNCSICYNTKVDSVLYRCGHMCTCLKCANELQWKSGKCPICRAKIVDVVRVYIDA